MYCPGLLAVLPDALSCKSEDQPQGAADERLKYCKRVLLSEQNFDMDAISDLLNQADSALSEDMHATPIELVLPEVQKLIDKLIDTTYKMSETAITMRNALNNPDYWQ